MFKSALVRLTGLYLLIIMIISLFFSGTIHQLATREFGKGFRDQAAIIDEVPAGFPLNLRQNLKNKRLETLEEARSSLLGSLFITNMTILILGGGLSYVLAKRTLEPIESAHNSLEQFTADASHEIRTPLAAMKTEIEVTLMQPTISDNNAREVLKSNLEEIDSLTKLTNGLLGLARLEETKLILRLQPIKPVIDSAIKKLKNSESDKNVKITSKYVNTEALAVFDYNSLQEMLIIILDNAVKFSNKEKAIDIVVRKKRDRMEVLITNIGKTIPKAELPLIFNRLYQSDESRVKHGSKGHGLGLSIAKQLVEAQGGLISVSSKNSKTTFTVSLSAQ